MTDIGEAISAPDFFTEEQHNEKTCPWHSDEKSAKPKEMDSQEPDEDVDSMPANLGTKLGENLKKDKEEKPNEEITVNYEEGQKVIYKVNAKKDGVAVVKVKEAQTYREMKQAIYRYPLKYAPHHLIPGNESLKVSQLPMFLGDDNVIKNFKDGCGSSVIKENQTVGYDVNQAENGVWLPSPYALSMSNKWTSVDGIKAIKKAKIRGVSIEETESFKHAYVAASIERSGGRQFHMRHNEYSDEVKNVLDKMADKMILMAGGVCPVASGGEEDDKFDAPKGLKSKLNMLSKVLERLLTGSVWHSPFYTDNKLMPVFADKVDRANKKAGKTTKKANIDKLL